MTKWMKNLALLLCLALVGNWCGATPLSQQLERKIQDQTTRPWQLVIVSVSHPTAGELEKSVLQAMKKNNALRHVIVVSVAPAPKATEFKLNAGHITQVNLSRTLSKTAPLLSVRSLLARLDRSNSKFYTGLVVDAHGSGHELHTLLQGEDKIPVQKFFEDIQQAGVKIDVLELKSCSMGSLATLYYATQSGVVDYLLASPPVLVESSADVGLLHAATQVPGALSHPAQAAQAAVLSGSPAFVKHVEKELGANIPPFTTAKVGYFLPDLRVPVKNWAHSLLGLVVASLTDSKGTFLLHQEELWQADLAQKTSREDSSQGNTLTQISLFQYQKRKLSLDAFLTNLLGYQMDIHTWAPQNQESYRQAFTLFKNDSLALKQHLNRAVKQGVCYHNGTIYIAKTAQDMDAWPRECLDKLSLDFQQVDEIVMQSRLDFSAGTYQKRLGSIEK
ncbi:MAG: hypothetical protein J6X06_00765 [Elusimicrobiaceae bacterium]|nr:hypothetical protein [Elusimicrobiaceae bacterium]